MQLSEVSFESKNLLTWLRIGLQREQCRSSGSSRFTCSKLGPMCKVARKFTIATVVHLAAPQLWAWAPWRIRQDAAVDSDHVMCLLPFEPRVVRRKRHVKATFIGHPAFQTTSQQSKLDLPTGSPNILYCYQDLGQVRLLLILPLQQAMS